ncbi:uncharacterized protein LAESUDRAFT_814078 [Laetiporus sulphureus 93-53]|uniref:Uncharacterized protein n=1 Tax=Laetiporus sulphureus 93-53 TaxID=1314785 RepID=A0A165DBB8_9APHY|nr:uncharacterized protein LAESUDRAFT_814078 [Laetiporus sulphureus 93-53]KZT04478.1 hypothetical protein LAESUDRAFT_814078 [Laetiporus sulphureus 93-53]
MSTPSSPVTPKEEQSGGANRPEKRAISEIISDTFPPFDHRSVIVEPFDSEVKRDAEFLEKLNDMLLEVMLEFHAWSTARPSFESDRAADALEKEVKTVMDMEKEQGMCRHPQSSLIEKTRQRLSDFVTRIKLALAALTEISG